MIKSSRTTTEIINLLFLCFLFHLQTKNVLQPCLSFSSLVEAQSSSCSSCVNSQLWRSCKGHVLLERWLVQTHAWFLGSVLGQQTARPGRVHVINFLKPPSGSFIGLGQIKLWQKKKSVVTNNVCQMSGIACWHSVIPFPFLFLT